MDEDPQIGEGDMTTGYNAMKSEDAGEEVRAPKEEWARYPKHSGTGPQGATGPLADPHVIHQTGATGATGMDEEAAGPEAEEEVEEDAVSEEEPEVAEPEAPVEEEEGEAEAEAEADVEPMAEEP